MLKFLKGGTEYQKASTPDKEKTTVLGPGSEAFIAVTVKVPTAWVGPNVREDGLKMTELSNEEKESTREELGGLAT
jgi:hypothetical protein